MIFTSYPKAQTEHYAKEIAAAISRVLDSPTYILGEETRSFEKEFAAFCGAADAVGVANGTDAISIALRGCGIGPGDEVITVSHTAIATVAAIAAVGATAVLVDVDPDTMVINAALARAAIGPKTKAIVAVHLYGQPAPMDELTALAKEHGLVLVEDCAQAHGARYRGQHVGTFGHAGCFSFYPTKNLGAIGDGGAVITNDAALAAKMRQLRQYGWDTDRVGQSVGVNSRLDEIQAAILRAKLPGLAGDVDRRRQIADLYAHLLKDAGLQLPVAIPNSAHGFNLYVVRIAGRDRVLARLAEAGISAGIHYAVPAHRHPGYAHCIRVVGSGGAGADADALPETDRIAATVLSLPIYPELTDAQVDKIAQAVKQSVRSSK
ncbi:MAG: DegT/DnrJ/EryC1/StrS family aminotransferase [Rhodobacteraceae bacterium]|nr:DegT/DnrJ/EryC1/StrS family aminotransferase [Paracoccaceae bacterium]